MTDEGTRLRPLTPEFQSDEHGEYVRILMAELQRAGQDAARNIALTGHYGSGKSSVLIEVQRQLTAEGVKVINLSLPSLDVGNARLETPGSKTKLNKTNLIQKEVVKQLLYRRKPADTPASRYNRLDVFQVRRARWRAAGAACGFTALALVARVPNKIKESFPNAFWNWFKHHQVGWLGTTLQWISLAVVFALAYGAVLWAQRLFHQRLRVTELAAGPAKVTLSENSTSFFDEYLDEIVYFFQNSQTTVVVFEDLDRFADQHIFETLRELNMLLNNAEQIDSKPICFVYAIRDSIFEKLDDDDEGRDDSAQERSELPAEIRRKMATNRTKFFDLVVPMVPFISHRTSRELIRSELATVEEAERPGPAITDLVSVHLTDMRLIKNICNEYDLFRPRILSQNGLDGLTPDRLFASIVYKNVYMGDYEKIRNAESLLDNLYEAFRDWVAERAATARETERVSRERLASTTSTAIAERSTQLGGRLHDVLAAWASRDIDSNQAQLLLNGTPHSWAQLTQTDFWRTYLKDPQDLTLVYRQGYQNESKTLSFDEIQTLMNDTLSVSDWQTDDRTELRERMVAATKEQRAVAQASMTDALGEISKTFDYGGEQMSLTDVAARLFDGANLTLDLLRAGYIDENFTLYVTQFPGQGSTKAVNFILKAVQPDAMDVEYQFSADAKLNAEDIETVLRAEGPRLLQGQSVYNVEVFDHLLANDPAKLEEPIRRLAADIDSYRRFVDAYISTGAKKLDFLERLSAHWPGIFDFVIADQAKVARISFLNAALRGANPSQTYDLTDRQRMAFASTIPRLKVIRDPQPALRARSMAEVLQHLGIKAKDISRVAQPLRNEMIARNVYEITRGNLTTILGEGELSLDSIKASNTEVYQYILDHLGQYLAVFQRAVVQRRKTVPTVVDPSNFADILKDVQENDPGELAAVAAGAEKNCMLDDLSDLDSSNWPDIARARRLRLTVPLVTEYANELDIDNALCEDLTAAQAFEVSGDESGRLELAVMVVNDRVLDDDTKLALLRSLQLERGSIAAAQVEEHAHALIPPLVEAGLVADNQDAFACLGKDDWDVKKALVDVSENFVDYMPSLTLNPNDLRDLASSATPDAVKEVLLREYATFEPTFAKNGSRNLATWLAARGHQPEAQVLLSLATKSEGTAAEPIIKLLGEQATSMERAMLFQVLNALGRPYDQLTTPGPERPRVPTHRGMQAILDRLKGENIVSRFKENQKKRQYEVSKRQ